MKMKQRLVIEVVFENTESMVPEAWDWNFLMENELAEGEHHRHQRRAVHGGRR